MPTIGPIWQSQACDEAAASALASALSIEPAVAPPLCQPGLGDPAPPFRFPHPTLRPDLAVINPKRHDCRYPDKYLAGVGVALKLVQALCQRAGRESWLPGFVKIAAIGTLADVVPLVGENRVIAKIGLELLSRGPHKIGLRALLDVCGLTGKA